MKTKLTAVLISLSILLPSLREGQGMGLKAQSTTLLNFAGTTNGSYPYGSLISDGTFLYGMTYTGGINGLGTIYKIMPNGTGYVKLLDFAGATNGSAPYGSLIFDGTFLYGMTRAGGINNLGAIFKIMPDGTGYLKLLDFAGATNGSTPQSSLISYGTFLYGMTQQGGTNGSGIIFKIMPDGTGYVKLLDFAGATNGSTPNGSLISDGTFLYGMTIAGGINNMGIIFKIMPDGTGYVKLLDFAGITNGSNPNGSLISDGTFLYGMTAYGGINDLGTIFKIMPDGTGYVKLLDFAGATNGRSPTGALIFDGTFLYGMTSQGGINNLGTIFKIMPDGTGYVKLLDFAGATNGSYPWESLISDGTFLYGMTRFGGINDLGVVFKLCNTTLIPTIAIVAAPAGVICAGTNVTFTASITNGGGAPFYQWQVNGANVGINSPSYSSSTLTNGQMVTCILTSNATCASPATVFSNSITMVVNPCVGIEESNINAISVFPNPTEGTVNISSLVSGIQTVSVTNMLGEKVLYKEVNIVFGSPFAIDITEQPAGIYLLRLGNSSKKIIKR